MGPWTMDITSDKPRAYIRAKDLQGLPAGKEAFAELDDDAVVLQVHFEQGDVRIIAPHPEVEATVAIPQNAEKQEWSAPKSPRTTGLPLPGDAPGLRIGGIGFSYRITHS
jgi:hypothetical protein